MSKTSTITNGNNLTFHLTHSYLSPKPNHERNSGSPSRATLGLSFDTKDTSREWTKRIASHKDTSLLNVSCGSISSEEVSNLRKLIEAKVYADAKYVPPSRKDLECNSKLLKTLNELLGNHQDQYWAKNNSSGPNELKTMDQVINQLRKNSPKKQISLEYEKRRINKQLNHNAKYKIPAHLQDTIGRIQEGYKRPQRTEPSLNSIILKKLGLDPATKEQQIPHFVPVGGRDFSGSTDMKKLTKANLSNLKFASLQCERIIPPDLLTQRSINSQGIEKVSGNRSKDRLSQRSMDYVSSEEEERRAYSANSTLIQLNAKMTENSSRKFVGPLSFPEIESKNEILPDCFGTPISNVPLAEEASPKFNEQRRLSLEKDLAEITELRSQMDEILKKEKKEILLVQENQRLTEELLSLKAKLKLYESKCPELSV